MDFALLQKGVELVAIATASLNISLTQASLPPQNSQIDKPVLIESYNITSENPIKDLNSITQEDNLGLKMVLKEPDPTPNDMLVTVEQPPLLYTVATPTPKPSAKPTSTPEAEGNQKPTPSEKPEASKQPEKTEEKVTKSPEPSSTPTPAPVGVLSSPNAEKLFQMANDYRTKLSKPAFEKDERLCKIAESRAPQVDGELAAGTLHKGFKDLYLSYWATENIAAYNSIEEDFSFWLSDYIHKAALESTNKYSCVACAGASCSQIFSSFVSK